MTLGRLLLWAGGLSGHPGIIINNHVLTEAQVRLQVELLSRGFDFIDHSDLPRRLTRRWARPFCLVTFDDGKRSNATQAGPTLKALGVPAVFYVVTGFLSQGHQPLWFDQYAALRQSVRTLPAELSGDVLKKLPHALRVERITRACRQYGVDADLTDEHIAPMTWAQARTLAAQGFVVGSHTEWHAILPNEDEHTAKEDIARSINTVAEELGRPCEAFAFPNGNYTVALARYAMSVGAVAVTTTEPRWVGASDEIWRLPRIQLFGEQSMRHQAAKIAAASAGMLLSNPDGTGRAYAVFRRRRAAGPEEK